MSKFKYQKSTEFLELSKPLIALDDGEFEFGWEPEQVNEVLRLWADGVKNAQSIGQIINRDPDEVAVLIIHLARKRKIDGNGVRW